jgi:hypothetical protein
MTRCAAKQSNKFLGCGPTLDGLLRRAADRVFPLWGWARMSCHVDVFLLMEHAAYVFNPERVVQYGTSECNVTKGLICALMGLARADRNAVRDVFWKAYLTHAHSDPLGRMSDVDNHVRTFAGIYPGSARLTTLLKIFYKFDRWITYDMMETCSVTTCNYIMTRKVMLHALVLPEVIMTPKGETAYEASLKHGMIRAIVQSSGVLQKCPACKDCRSLVRTKAVDTITLPRRLVVALDSNGRLCKEHPPLRLEICEGRSYTLVGVALRNSGHYTCNVLVGDRWFHYDDGGGCPTPVFKQITYPTYLPSSTYNRRMLYYSLSADAPLLTPSIHVPTWMPARGAPEGGNDQEELVE